MNDHGGAQAVTWADVESAAQRLDGVAHRTPVMTSRTVDARTGAGCSSSARTSSASAPSSSAAPTTRSSRLAPEQRRRGVLAFSSGNHAQAVALAGPAARHPARRS